MKFKWDSILDLHPNYARGISSDVEIDDQGRLVIRVSEIAYLNSQGRMINGFRIPANIKPIPIRNPYRLRENTSVLIITPYRIKNPDLLAKCLLVPDFATVQGFPLMAIPFPMTCNREDSLVIPAITFARAEVGRGEAIGTVSVLPLRTERFESVIDTISVGTVRHQKGKSSTRSESGESTLVVPGQDLEDDDPCMSEEDFQSLLEEDK